MDSKEVTSFKYPQCWEDDVRMNSLFAPFRARSLNPTDWDSKMKFWESLIEQWCIHHKQPFLDIAVLPNHFRRKDKVPSCIKDVVENLYRNNVLVGMDVFNQMTEQSWKNWAIEILIGKPLRWTLGKVKTTIMRGNNELPTPLIHLSALKVLADQLQKSIPEEYQGKLFDSKQIQQFLKLSNLEVVYLLLNWLSCQKLVCILQNETNWLVKFPKKDNGSCVISDVDKALYSLEKNKDMLENKINKLETEKEHLLNETKKHVADKKMILAKSTLRRKKTVENVIQKMTDAVDNITSLIYQMQMAEMDTVILECYETGVASLNKFFKENGLTKDKVLSTRAELEEVLTMKNDIDDVLSESLNKPSMDDSNEELEEELKQLLDESSDSVEASKKEVMDDSNDDLLAKLPDVPLHKFDDSSETKKIEKKLASLAI